MSEKEYIERGALSKFVRDVRRKLPKDSKDFFTRDEMLLNFQQYVDAQPAADVEPVVRCVKCKYGTPLKRNACDVHGLHCAIGRGEEVRNVWHKYSKHYEDYSLVDIDGFCDQGEAGEPSMERSGSGDDLAAADAGKGE